MGKVDEDVASKVTDAELAAVKEDFGFPEGAVLIVPEPHERPQRCPADFVLFYDYPFRLGFRYPFSPLVRQICELFDMSPGQLMPSVWRVLWVLENACSNWSVKPTLPDLCSFYEFRKKELGRVTVYKRSGVATLVLNLEVGDKGWKSKYFYVDKQSLGESGKPFRGGWNSQALRLDAVGPRDGNQATVDNLIALPANQRSFSTFASAPAATTSAAATVSGSLSATISASLAVSSSMASGNSNKVLGQSEALARLKRKREETSGGSTSVSEQDVLASTRSPHASQNVRAQTFVAPRDRPMTRCDISLPGDFLSADGLGNAVFPAADRLLFPGAKDQLKKKQPAAILTDSVQLQLQTLQNTLYLKAFVKSLEDREKVANNKVKRAEEENKKLAEEKQKVSKELLELGNQLSEARQRADAAEKGLKDLQDNWKDAEALATVKIKASMANKFLLKKFEGKDKQLRNLVDDYLNFGNIKDLESDDEGEVAGDQDQFTTEFGEKAGDDAAKDHDEPPSA